MEKYNLIVSKSAERDLDDAAGYYESQRRGLGFEFALSFEEALDMLQTSPFIYQKVYEEIRKMQMRDFPYLVFYVVEEQYVKIFAVLHGKKSAELIESRVRLAFGE